MKRCFGLCSGTVVLLAFFIGTQADCKVTINYMTWYGNGPEGDALRKAVSSFELRYPDIKVSITNTTQSGYYQRYLQLSAEGKAPDVVDMDSGDAWRFVETKVVEDLGRYLGGGKKITDSLLKEYVNLYNYKGYLSAIPRKAEVPALAYNTMIFQDAGLQNPDLFEKAKSWNWATFRSFAKKITVKRSGIPGQQKPDIWGYGELPHWTWDYWVYGNGGSLLSQDNTKCTLDSDESVKALQFQMDLVSKYKVAPATGYYIDDFGDNRLGMVFGTAPMFTKWKAMEPALKWKLASFPWEKQPYTRLSATGLALSRQSHRKLYAWDFIRFMSGPEAQRIMQQGNPWAVPINTQAFHVDNNTPHNEYQEVLIKQAQRSDSKNNPFGVPLPDKFQQTLTIGLAEFWAKKLPPEDAKQTITNLVLDLNKVLDDWNRKRLKRLKSS